MARPPGYPKAPTNPQYSNLELMMENFVLTQTKQHEDFK